MQQPDNEKWVKVAESIGELFLPESGLKELEVNGKKICVGLHKDQLYACVARCPHAGGLLADGYIDAQGNIVCPLHRYKFNLQNGRNLTGEGYHLKTWPVQQRADGIYIAMEKKSFFF